MGISKEKKQLLCNYMDYKCEICHKKFILSNLQIHRIRPSYEDGTYENFKNCMVVCKKCHEILNSAQRMALGLQ